MEDIIRTKLPGPRPAKSVRSLRDQTLAVSSRTSPKEFLVLSHDVEATSLKGPPPTGHFGRMIAIMFITPYFITIKDI